MAIDLPGDDPDEAEPRIMEPHTPGGRVGFLDGLRGTMCVVVIIYHSVQQFPDKLDSTSMQYTLNGKRAVEIFWCVSGYALALVNTRDRAVLAAIGRLPRLMLPVVFLGFVTSVVNFAMIFVSTQKDIADNFLLNKHRAFQCFECTGQDFNWMHIWTMRVELYGSLALFFGHELLKNTEQPVRLVCAGAVLALYVEPKLNFILIGYVMCTWAPPNQWFSKHYDTDVGTLVSGGSLIVFFGTLVANSIDHSRFGPGWQLVRYIGAASIFVCVLSTRKMERVFDNAVIGFIGRYSFELYISHYPIMQRCYDIPWVKHHPVTMVPTLLALTFAWSLLVQRHVNAASLVLSKKNARSLYFKE